MSIYRDLLQQPGSEVRAAMTLNRDEYDHYQALHHMMDQLVKQGNGVVFSGTHVGAGTTTLLHQFAAYFSEAYQVSDQRILVVDGNCTHPELHHVFGVENAMGLSEMFLTDQFEKVVQRNVMPQVDFVSNGAGRLYVPENVLQASLSDVSQQLAAYRYVLVDAPPLFAHPDAALLGRVFGNMVLLCEYGKSKSDMVAEAKRRVDSAGITMVGAVVNKYKHSIPSWIYDRI